MREELGEAHGREAWQYRAGAATRARRGRAARPLLARAKLGRLRVPSGLHGASVREPPTVGIVTPTLNAAAYLRGAIESVLAQDHPDIDYLVMGGGSTDGSRDLLASYGDRVGWISAPDAGQADAINRGWQLVDGDLLAYLNADWDDGRISRLHVSEHGVPPGAATLRIAGRRHAYLDGPLRLRVRLGGAPVARLELAERGPFELTAAVPGRTVLLTIEAQATWTREDGDHRRLARLIDSIAFA